VIYGSSFRSAEYEHYVTAPVKTLKLVNGNRIVYDMKYLDRSGLIKLVNRKIADDILIIKRNCVTDTSYSNIVFTDGRKWFTPDIPLLRGTMREKLLSQGVIHEERITVDKIGSFTHFRLINAMLGFNHSVQPVKNIF
jgi:4-amino-4-deoxychorismate lyase